MIDVQWDNLEQTIVRVDYADPVKSWEEYQEATQRIYEMVRSKPATVHIIHNPGKTKMPPGNPLMHVTRALRSSPANTGCILMVVDDMLARRVLEAVLRLIINKNVGFAKSIEDARQRISNTVKATS